MNKHTLFLVCRRFGLLVLALGALGLSSCSTTESRAQSNPQILTRLSEGDRALVLSGRVREGLTREAVFIAWGRPDRVFAGSRGGKQYEAWIFTSSEVRYAGGFDFFPRPYYTSRVVFSPRHGRYFVGGYGDPFFYQPYPATYTVQVPFRKVQFENGRVVSFAERRQP